MEILNGIYCTHDEEYALRELLAFRQVHQVVFQYERIAIVFIVAFFVLSWPRTKVHVNQFDLRKWGS